MSFIKLQRVPDNIEKSQKKGSVKLELPAVLGRGPLLKCPEKKVSRNHTSIDWDDEGVILIAMHVGPTYIKKDNKSKVLNKGDSIVLKNGDQFGLLPTTFWFRIIIEDPEPTSGIPSPGKSNDSKQSTALPEDLKETTTLPADSKETTTTLPDDNAMDTSTLLKIDLNGLQKNRESLTSGADPKTISQLTNQVEPKDEELKRNSMIKDQNSEVLLSPKQKILEYKNDRSRNLPNWMQNLPQHKENENPNVEIKTKPHGQTEKKTNKSPKKTKVTKPIKNKNPSLKKRSENKGALHDLSDDGEEITQLPAMKRTKTDPSTSKLPEADKPKMDISSVATNGSSPSKANKKKSPIKIVRFNPTKASPSKVTKKATKVSRVKAYHSMSLETDDGLSHDAVSSDDEEKCESSKPSRDSDEEKTKLVKPSGDNDEEKTKPSKSSGDNDEEKTKPSKPSGDNDEEKTKPSKSSGDNDEENQISKSDNDSSDDVEETSDRLSCQFGSNCYRKNPAHKREFAHLGDDDFVPPMDIDSDEQEDGDLPECEFGVDCFRKNPQHIKAYKHTRYPQPRRKVVMKAKRKQKAQDDNDSDEDYDYDDPFLNDDSSDDYAPTDSDTDCPMEDDAAEEDDTERMLKEAKKFTKK